MEPLSNEPPYNEVLGITNDCLYPSNSKIYEKEPRYSKQKFPVPSPFVKYIEVPPAAGTACDTTPTSEDIAPQATRNIASLYLRQACEVELESTSQACRRIRPT